MPSKEENHTQFILELALLPTGVELQGDCPDSAFNETLDHFILRARKMLLEETDTTNS